MQVFTSMSRLSNGDMYSFNQLFTKVEIAAGRWFITNLYERDAIVELVEDLGGDPTMVRSHPDSDDTFFFAIVG